VAVLNTYRQDDFDAVAAEMNGRPRKTLGFLISPGPLKARLASGCYVNSSITDDLSAEAITTLGRALPRGSVDP
jgi:hypothetical protein